MNPDTKVKILGLYFDLHKHDVNESQKVLGQFKMTLEDLNPKQQKAVWYKACTTDDPDVLQQLADFGLSLSNCGDCPLDVASKGSVAMVRWFCEHGYDPTTAHPNVPAGMNTLLNVAVTKNHLPVVQYLAGVAKVKGPALEAAFRLACRMDDHVPMVTYLLDQEIDINAACAVNGWTALHHAVDRGCVNVVELLLDRGANWRSKTKMGNSVVTFATSQQCRRVLDKFVKAAEAANTAEKTAANTNVKTEDKTAPEANVKTAAEDKTAPGVNIKTAAEDKKRLLRNDRNNETIVVFFKCGEMHAILISGDGNVLEFQE